MRRNEEQQKTIPVPAPRHLVDPGNKRVWRCESGVNGDYEYKFVIGQEDEARGHGNGLYWACSQRLTEIQVQLIKNVLPKGWTSDEAALDFTKKLRRLL